MVTNHLFQLCEVLIDPSHLYLTQKSSHKRSPGTRWFELLSSSSASVYRRKTFDRLESDRHLASLWAPLWQPMWFLSTSPLLLRATIINFAQTNDYAAALTWKASTKWLYWVPTTLNLYCGYTWFAERTMKLKSLITYSDLPRQRIISRREMQT